MRKRTGDWRDLLSGCVLKLSAEKAMLGFIAVLIIAFILLMGTLVDSAVIARGWTPTPEALTDSAQSGDVLVSWVEAARIVPRSTDEAGTLMPRLWALLNLFNGGLAHFIVSGLTYVALFWVLSGYGGTISRLVALDYARDDLPTLDEASQFVRARRMAFFLAPVAPLAIVAACALVNAVVGLVGWIPYFGRICMLVGYPVALVFSLITLFVVVVGILAFGMMMPALAVGGKGALDGWITAFNYVLWSLVKFVLYAVIIIALGIVATAAAVGLVGLLNYIVDQTVGIGFLSSIPWAHYTTPDATPEATRYHAFFQVIMAVMRLIVCALPIVYAFSYYFSANTVLFFLMRKEVDNVDIDEIYVEEPEAPAAQEGVGEPVQQPSEQEEGQPEQEDRIKDEELQEPGEEEEPKQPPSKEQAEEPDQEESEQPEDQGEED
jgi:hypothetical protein